MCRSSPIDTFGWISGVCFNFLKKFLCQVIVFPSLVAETRLPFVDVIT